MLNLVHDKCQPVLPYYIKEFFAYLQLKIKQINGESHKFIQRQSYGNFLFHRQFLQRILQNS